MAHGLADYFMAVHATDIHNHGGEIQHGPPLDFLSPAADVITEADWIVTNPPFGQAAAFVEAGLRRARRGVAILARATFYESARRYDLFHGASPCGVKAQFFERVPMQLGAWGSEGLHGHGLRLVPVVSALRRAGLGDGRTGRDARGAGDDRPQARRQGAADLA